MYHRIRLSLLPTPSTKHIHVSFHYSAYWYSVRLSSWALVIFVVFSEYFFLITISTVFLSRFFIWVIAWRTAIQSMPTHLFGQHFSFLISQNSNNKKYQGSRLQVVLFCTTYAFSRSLRIVREYKLFTTTQISKKEITSKKTTNLWIITFICISSLHGTKFVYALLHPWGDWLSHWPLRVVLSVELKLSQLTAFPPVVYVYALQSLIIIEIIH